MTTVAPTAAISIRLPGFRRVARQRGAELAGTSDRHIDELVAATARRDRAAFSELYDRMAPRLFGLIRRIVRDRAISEEIFQEVMLEIWQRADTIDTERGSPIGWMITLAHRRAVDRVRSEEASRRRLAAVGTAQHEPAFDDTQAAAEMRDERARLLAALGNLSEPQRQAIELAYYGGRTHSEVAELLGAPLGTVKTRIRDGLSKLRTTLGDEP